MLFTLSLIAFTTHGEMKNEKSRPLYFLRVIFLLKKNICSQQYRFPEEQSYHSLPLLIVPFDLCSQVIQLHYPYISNIHQPAKYSEYLGYQKR